MISNQRLFLSLLVAVLVVGLSGCPLLGITPPSGNEGENTEEGEDLSEGEALSEGELDASELSFVSAFGGGDGGFEGGQEIDGGVGMTTDEGPEIADTDGGDDTREVVEPDVIRREGNLLYVLNQYRGLSVVDLDTEEILAQVPTYGLPRDLYVVGERAYVLVGYAHQVYAEGGMMHASTSSRLYVINVADPAAAAVLGEPFDLEGDFVDSRLVGDVLYAVNAHYNWYYEYDDEFPEDDVVTDEVMPDGDMMGDDAVSVDAEPTRGMWTKEAISESWVSSVSVADPENIHVVDEQSFEGYGNIIQATQDAIFVASTEWGELDAPTTTNIIYVDISDPAGAIVVGDTVAVPGWVADRFKMDAYNGVLRVVSHSGWGEERMVYITTVDLSDPQALAILGETTLEDAAGESLFATRFDGDRVYIVTYFMVDPLWIVDLSDPANPTVTGELEVPGWSTHIEPRGDYLIALGVDDTEGRRVMVSLFDVSDPAAPLQSDVVSFGDDWSWSEAYGDVKAFTVLDDVLIVPVSGWSEQGSYDTLQFISYTPTSLSLGGAVALEGSVSRSFAYDANYYGVTSQEVAVIDAADLSAPVVVSRIVLAENVRDIVVLSDDVTAEIVMHRSELRLRTTAADGSVLGTVTLEFPQLLSAHAWNDSVVLVGAAWDETSYLNSIVVTQVDCADPTLPTASEPLLIEAEPWYGGYYGGYYDGGIGVPEPMFAEEPGMMVDKMMAADIWYGGPGWGVTQNAWIVGDRLVMRSYWRSGTWDAVLGNENAYQGLEIVALDTMEWTASVGLGYAWIDGIHAAGDQLYLGIRREVVEDDAGRRLSAHFLQSFDPLTLEAGSLVNVPGRFLRYDPATEVLVLQDIQYREQWETMQRVNTLRWDGGVALQLIDAMGLPTNPNTVMASESRIFFTFNDAGQQLGSITLDDAGTLTLGQSAVIAEEWVRLLAVQGDNAFIGHSGALARFDCSAAPTLEELTQTMGYPERLRLHNNTAYAPMGFFGVSRMDW
jgi:hypothetical protein